MRSNIISHIFVEEHRGYKIYRAGDALEIYDKNGVYVKRVESLIVRYAKFKIDEVIAKDRRRKS